MTRLTNSLTPGTNTVPPSSLDSCRVFLVAGGAIVIHRVVVRMKIGIVCRGG